MNGVERNRLIQTLGRGPERYYVYLLCRSDGTPFHVDIEIPAHVGAFSNCIPTLNGTTEFLTTKAALRNPIVLNFK